MQSRAAGDAPRAAIYCRLSEEDADKADPGQDSRSIQNQKSMLVRYAVEQGWQIYNIYSDDDYTGSDRERPQFNRLLEDSRRGCFDIVLCKSQSRFTREMELVEKYIHGLFVEWSVRFVGYADNADTANRGNKKARQINGLVNEWYLEDMSQNIRTVLDAKRRQGEFVGSFASYGYRKDPQDKHRLLVDEPAAAVVRRIYALYLSGWGASRIAAQLNREQVPNPSAYKKQNNPAFNRGRSTALAELWSDSTVLGILKKQVYTGTTVQHVNEKISYKSKRLRRLPPERRGAGNPCGGHRHGNMGGRSAEAGGGGSGAAQGRQAGRAGGKMPLRAVRRKAAKQIRPCGKIPAVPHPRCGPGALPGCEHPAGRGRAVCAGGAAGLHGAVSGPGISGAASASAGGCGAQAGTAGAARRPAGAGAGTPARLPQNAV